MKKIILMSVIISGFLSSNYAQNYLIKAYYDSDKLNSAWEKYKTDPSEENALTVYNLLPEKGVVQKEDSNLELNEDIFQNLNIVENQIIQEQPNSIKLAFRLFSISDGAFSEVLYMIIGKLIRINPELFLTELKEHFHLVSLIHLLSNYGPEYWDDINKMTNETEKRIDALKGVSNRELLILRDQCIEELDEYLIGLKG